MPNGPEKLAQYLNRHGITRGEAAKALGVTRVTLWKWINGLSKPLEPARADIQAWTNDEVMMGSWGAQLDKRKPS